MKTYRVNFYYYTDLRTDWEGEADNELIALVKAYEKIRLPTGFWSDMGKGFRTSIERIK